MNAATDFEDAVRNRDAEGSEHAFDAMCRAIDKAGDEEFRDAGPRLAAVLGEVPPGPRGVVAVIVGACVERGADPVACAPGVFAGALGAFRQAEVFCERWAAGGGGELPEPDQGDPAEDVVERVGFEAANGWWTLPQWEMAGVAMLSHRNVRQQLGEQRDLAELVDRVARASDEPFRFKCLSYALRVRDDEPLVVLHRESRTGYLLRMSGIGDNFQLHTLLAAALIGGGHVAGDAPSAEAVAVCRDTEGQAPTVGSFNLVAPDGEWIWNEGNPSDIPLVDGARLLVLDPPPYRRHWDAGRFFPNMPGDLTLERVLGEQETVQWFTRISEAKVMGA
ncbi:hypothetical protein GCM10020367_19300 [Streptomyces sannanensis]|uniref:Uncharacterized protein n=1 Tax=Streptomyces sannanensis TaxID=285536 RepID=A0ABP6S947_9ACTN